MCFTTPARVLKIEGNKALLDLNGKMKVADTSLVKGVKVNDLVIVNGGFIIEILTK